MNELEKRIERLKAEIEREHNPEFITIMEKQIKKYQIQLKANK